MFENISALSEKQIEQLHALYQREWWTRGRTLADVKEMLLHCDIVFGICAAGELVAFARVLTDYVFRAFVYDVIVAEAYRGQGLGQSLIEQILTHPRLSDVAQVQLSCRPEMAPFYERYDFAQTEQIFMLRPRRDNPD